MSRFVLFIVLSVLSEGAALELNTMAPLYHRVPFHRKHLLALTVQDDDDDDDDQVTFDSDDEQRVNKTNSVYLLDKDSSIIVHHHHIDPNTFAYLRNVRKSCNNLTQAEPSLPSSIQAASDSSLCRPGNESESSLSSEASTSVRRLVVTDPPLPVKYDPCDSFNFDYQSHFGTFARQVQTRSSEYYRPSQHRHKYGARRAGQYDASCHDDHYLAWSPYASLRGNQPVNCSTASCQHQDSSE